MFRETLFVFGTLQAKMLEAGTVSKGVEDVVGSVKGYLQANK